MRGLGFLSAPPILTLGAPAVPLGRAAPFGNVSGRFGVLSAAGDGRWRLFYAFTSVQYRSRITPPPVLGGRERRLSSHARDRSAGFRIPRPLRRGGGRAGRCIEPRRLSWSGSLEFRRTSRAASPGGHPGVCEPRARRRTSPRLGARGRLPSPLSASDSGRRRTWAAGVEGQPSSSSWQRSEMKLRRPAPLVRATWAQAGLRERWAPRSSPWSRRV